MSNLHTTIAEAVEKYDNDDDAASAIIDVIAETDWRLAIRPLVTREVVTVRRNRVRAMESPTRGNPDTYEKKASNLEETSPLGWVRERVYVSLEIGYKTWADLTEKDNLVRAELLETNARGLLKTAGKHRLAAELIVNFKVDTVGDLPDEAKMKIFHS